MIQRSCMVLLFAVAFTSGCTFDAADNESPTVTDRSFAVPTDPTYQQLVTGTPLLDDYDSSFDPVIVDVGACRYERVNHSEPLGAKQVLSHPAGERCEVWLVEIGDFPRYLPPPNQYCLLARDGEITFRAYPEIDATSCVPLVAKVPDRAAFDAAVAAAPIVEHPGDSIAIDIAACTLARHTIGAASAIVRPSEDPATPGACEIFLANAAGPGLYCGFEKWSESSMVTAALDGDRLAIDSPTCFQPAY